MNLRIGARLGAGAIIGLLNGLRDILDHKAGHAMGKAAFLARQAGKFDRYYAGNYSAWRSLFVGVVISAIILSIYEVIAAVLVAARRSGKTVEGIQPR